MNLINTKDLEALSKLSPSEFEIQRKVIIDNYIKTLPADKQKSARAIQNDLDLKRLSLSPSDFLIYCTARIKTNLETIGNLADQASIMASEMRNVLAKNV